MNGVYFGDKHSYRNWGLLLKSRPVISPPTVKSVYVDIPGSDGVIDLTESLTGDVKFENRTLTCEFAVIDSRNRWSDIYSEIMDYLHGQQLKIIFDDDPTYYYIGRVQVNDWKSDKKYSIITIEGNVEPYKMEMFSSLENWEWDPFNFETGIIREYKNLRIDGSLTFNIEGRRKAVVPSFIVNSDDGSGLSVKFNGSTFKLSDGTNRLLGIVIKDGLNTLEFTGNGTISIDYRGGRL